MSTTVDRASWRRTMLLATGAFVLYGGWAYLANRSHGPTDAIRSGVAQGALSFVSTSTITIAMEWAFGRHQEPRRRVAAAMAAGCVPMYVVTVGVHAIIGTPELLATVTPVLVAGTVYCAIYSTSLLRLRPGVGTSHPRG